MATKITLRGYFGVKEAFNVSAATVTTGWKAGNLFQYGGDGFYAQRPSYIGDYVVTATTVGGWPIAGVALESSTDTASAASGMVNPSGSKVTLVHGHSRFEIVGGETAAVWASGVESAPVNSPLYCSTAGTWTTSSGSTHGTGPIGMLTKVPRASNNWTLGVVLFG
jgi:hypothetical protein